MFSLPRKFFSWREPQDFAAARWRYEWSTLTPREQALLRGAALFLPNLPWLLTQFLPMRGQQFLCLGLLTSFFLLWCLPRLWLKMPSYVRVFEDMIVLSCGSSQRKFPFVEIASFHWEKQASTSTLKLIRKKGNEVSFALAKEVDRAQLEAFLQERVKRS